MASKDMTFQWDPNKDSINQKKHGFGFNKAKDVFDDPNMRTRPSVKSIEPRDENVGFVKFLGKVITVITCDRTPDKRIISARKANKNEEGFYNE